jgi:hypothetical protein
MRRHSDNHTTMRIRLFVLLFAVGVIPLNGTPSRGGKGLFYVHSAAVLPKGSLEFHAGIRYFGKIASLGTSGKAYTLWDVQNNLSFNYGVSRHLELACSPVLYQDINRSGGNFLRGSANLPDDLYLSAKIGSYTSLESPFVFGGLISLRLPTAKVHNVIYEPYSAGSVELGISALATYYHNVAFPDMGWSAIVNLGYLNHNDVGKSLSEDDNAPTPQHMSSEIIAGWSFLYPAGPFNFSAEITARHFLTRPPETAYSREYVSYLTFGVCYNLYRWCALEMAFDKSLFSGVDETDYRYIALRNPGFPNYPGWRGILGVKLAILPFSLYKSEEADLKQKAKDRQTIMEKMIENQTDMQSAEQELTRIQAERKNVEEELERLRKLLESEKTNETKPNTP